MPGGYAFNHPSRGDTTTLQKKGFVLVVVVLKGQCHRQTQRNNVRKHGLIASRILCATSLAVAAMAGPTFAEDKVHYCVVEHTVGITGSGDSWEPAYSDGSNGKRYTIRFSGEYAELTGLESTETPYYCQRAFPNKAPDVVTCVNSRVATMVFNYSTESGRFVLNMVSPGGWLSVGTERAKDENPMNDYLVLGKCQAF